MKNTKETIKKLRQEAEAKIAEANRLEKSIPKSGQSKVIKSLHKQFKKLENGFELKWQPKSRFEMPVITGTAQWFSDEEPEFDQDIDTQLDRAIEDYSYTLHEEFDAWVKDRSQVIQYRKAIKALCDESDRQAKKFRVDEHDFFEMVMTGECS